MSNYNLEIQKLLLKRDKTDSPFDKINILKEAIAIADAHQDLDWSYDLRHYLLEDERDTASSANSFPAFAWIINAHDENPEMFPEDDFLWKYKWLLASAYRTSSIPLEQVRNIHEDFKKRLERNGYSLRAYYGGFLNWALVKGDVDEVLKYYNLREEAPYDDMSDCMACEADDRVEVALIQDNLELALSEGQELLSKKLTCAHMPFYTYCNLLAYYNQKGDELKAAEYFEKVLEELDEQKEKGYVSFISQIGTIIYYLHDKNSDLAWKYFEEYVKWTVQAEDVLLLNFAQKVLLLFKTKEEVSLQIPTQVEWFNATGIYKTSDLYDYYYNIAFTLAEKFDRRESINTFTNKLKTYTM